MAGTLDRVKRIRAADHPELNLPPGLLPRGGVFEITELTPAARAAIQDEVRGPWDLYDRIAALPGDVIIKAAGNMAWPMGPRTERLAREVESLAREIRPAFRARRRLRRRPLHDDRRRRAARCSRAGLHPATGGRGRGRPRHRRRDLHHAPRATGGRDAGHGRRDRRIRHRALAGNPRRAVRNLHGPRHLVGMGERVFLQPAGQDAGPHRPRPESRKGMAAGAPVVAGPASGRSRIA